MENSSGGKFLFVVQYVMGEFVGRGEGRVDSWGIG